MRQAGNSEDSLGLYTEIVEPDLLVRDPLVSVVMTTYNHEPYIAQAIEGVASQERDFPMELLIGEDCSTDRTREIVLDYQRRYPEIIRVLLSGRNAGMHENGRRTILAARGRYMAFCEGDDWWHRRDKLKIQIPFLRDDNSLVCLSADYRPITAQGQVMRPDLESLRPQPPIRVEYEDLLTFRVFFFTCATVAKTDAVRRALLGDTLCGDHSQLMGDLPLWIELSQMGRMMYLREILASYRVTPNSASRRRDPLYSRRFQISMLDVQYRALERYPLPGDASRTSSLKADSIRQIMPKAAWVGDVAVARNQLIRLRDLGRKVGWKEIACVALATIPLPRRSLIMALRKINALLVRIGLNPRKYLGQPDGPPRVAE